MKKIDLGQTITILANLGVIAGIVFLAVELRQNNSELASQTRTNLYQMRAQLQTDYINNVGGLADIYVKVRHGDELSESEASRLGSRRSHMFRTLEYMFSEDPDGMALQVEFILILFQSDPGMLSHWRRNPEAYQPDFVSFMNKSVINRVQH